NWGRHPSWRRVNVKVRCRAPVARQAHNLEVGGSIPPGATSESLTATPRWPSSLRIGPGRWFPRETGPALALAHRRSDLPRRVLEGGEDVLFPGGFPREA